MIHYNIPIQSPLEHIAFDEWLLHHAQKEQGGEAIRFWESDVPFVVLGRTCSLEGDVNQDLATQDNVPILRRASGGGTVVQGKGCFNYTLILSKQRSKDIADIRQSYQHVSQMVIDTLKGLSVEAGFYPISDLAVVSTQKKFSGNAQRRVKDYILHHGTILYDFDLKLIYRYLKMPKDIPEYRNKRTHEDFVTNIDINSDDFKKKLCDCFDVKDSIAQLSDQQTLSFASFYDARRIKI